MGVCSTREPTLITPYLLPHISLVTAGVDPFEFKVVASLMEFAEMAFPFDFRAACDGHGMRSEVVLVLPTRH
jgi:hypothetical protein